MTMRLCRQISAVAIILFATPSVAAPPHGIPPLPQVASPVIPVANEPGLKEPDTDIFALMSGRCSTLRIAGRDFACRTVAFFHNENGRVNFTVALSIPPTAAMSSRSPANMASGRSRISMNCKSTGCC